MAAASKKTAVKKSVTKKAVKPVKKTAAVKKAEDAEIRSKSALGIKYSDKSSGQEQLIPVFNTLAKLFQPYVKGSMKQKGGSGGEIALISDKPVEIEGRKKPEMHFAAALIQKGYVGFYYMPAYMNPEFTKAFKETELMKTLKGKACFHIKKLDDTLIAQIKDALKTGYEMYKKKGWIE